MRPLRLVLPGVATVGDLDDHPDEVLQALADLYAYPDPLPSGGWVRASMVSSLDGSVAGADGRSGSVASRPDRVLFGVLRGLADVVLVGAGTVRAERYRSPRAKPEFAQRRAAAGQAEVPALAVVTRSGDVPRLGPDGAPLFGGPAGAWLITCADADLSRLRALAGAERVLVAGEDRVDPQLAVTQLAARGLRRVLLEGGPRLLGDTVAADRLDELCLTLSPLLVAGGGARIALGPAAGTRARLAHLAECEGSLLGRWLVQRP